MNQSTSKEVYANFDALSRRGMFSRGKPIYRGASHTPNPTGANQWTASPKFDQKSIERRMKRGRRT